MAKFNSTITAYFVPYITEGCDNKNFCNLVSLLLKVEHISYTIGANTLPDIYTLARGPPWYNYSIYVCIACMYA